MQKTAAEKKYQGWIITLSIVLPIAIGVLFSVKLKNLGVNVTPLTFLPPIYAAINGVTAILLVWAVQSVKKGNRALHERLMKIAIGCSVAFLVLYVAYHMTTDNTVFGDIDHDGKLSAAEKLQAGPLRIFYLILLSTHIILSVVIIPMVLVSYVRALGKSFERHKKIARVTYPLWLYVAVTGVIVYFLISPYYA